MNARRARPIVKPDDCRGLKIRTLDNDIHRRSLSAL
jgi:TRAP-type C4-dicarboxylate transport system substrate-binding protein